MQLHPDDVKVIRALDNARLRERLVEMLQRRLSTYDKSLRVTKPDVIQLIQGRAQELSELIEILTSKE